ncbi:MAG: hypothetical protein QNK23_05990 [Crocinitomicaceae bacterium]|nr:hypothetical protein [Crocinitomicaceae bacterium]
MKKFLVNIALFGICLLIVDKALILIRDQGPELEVDKRLEFIVTGQIQNDILIFGSSRGARSVVADQITDSLNRTCYNLSYPGSDITFHEYLLRATLDNEDNQKPSTIVLVVDDGDEFKRTVALKFRFDRMFPLVEYKAIRDELVRRNQKKWFFADILVAHQLNKDHLMFEQKKFTKRDSVMSGGSMLIWEQKKDFDYVYKSEPYIYSTQGEFDWKLKAFTEFVELCKKNNIELVIAIPPNYRVATDGFKERVEELLDGYGTVYEFDPNIEEYKDDQYFFDNAHLLKTGAHLFTAELAEFLKDL